MAIKWAQFVGVCAIAWLLLLRMGAPLGALMLGTAAVACWNAYAGRGISARR